MSPEVKAEARLVATKDVWLWVVDECPFCGRRHTHGGGDIAGDPRQLLSHRTSHCTPYRLPRTDRVIEPEVGDYLLVEAGQ